MNTSTTSVNTPVDSNEPPLVRAAVECIVTDTNEDTPVVVDVSPLTVDTPLEATRFASTADGNVHNTSAARSLCYLSLNTTNPSLSDELFEQGYDSDGQLPFIQDNSLEIEQMEKYNGAQVGNEDDVTNAGQEPSPADDDRGIDGGGFILISNDAMKKLLVDGLKKS